MKDEKYFTEVREVILKIVRNLPLLIWTVGQVEIMTQYVELFGNTYAQENVNGLKSLKLFDEKEIES